MVFPPSIGYPPGVRIPWGACAHPPVPQRNEFFVFAMDRQLGVGGGDHFAFFFDGTLANGTTGRSAAPSLIVTHCQGGKGQTCKCIFRIFLFRFFLCITIERNSLSTDLQRSKSNTAKGDGALESVFQVFFSPKSPPMKGVGGWTVGLQLPLPRGVFLKHFSLLKIFMDPNSFGINVLHLIADPDSSSFTNTKYQFFSPQGMSVAPPPKVA